MKIINNITNVKNRIIFILWNQHYGNKLERMRKKGKLIQECILFLLLYLYNAIIYHITLISILKTKNNYYNRIKRSINPINYNNLKFDLSIKTPNLFYRSHDHSQNSIFVENF